MTKSRFHGLSALIGAHVIVRSVAGRFYVFGVLTSVSESTQPDTVDTVEIEMVSGQKVNYSAKHIEVAKVGEFV